MNGFGKSPIIRQAELSDEFQLRRLIQRKSFLHTHLGWLPPLSWLGKQPFFVQVDEQEEFQGALACPPDSEGLVWLRLFVTAPGISKNHAWQRLWPTARTWLEEHQSGTQVHSLAISDEMEELLLNSGFQEISQVISLVWEVKSAHWPETRKDVLIREMTPEDLPRVMEIDRAAFQPLWRNSLDELQAAYAESFYATVGLKDDHIEAYQISTINPQGCHLARLAVDPEMQGRGLGRRILDDLLDSMIRTGHVEVSVNTQVENASSLALYHKFGFQTLEGVFPILGFQV